MSILRIQGPNPLLNIYRNNQERSIPKEDKRISTDKLNISTVAKSLQQNEKVALEREQYIKEIKNRVDNGEYEVDAEQTAHKMLAFWSNRNAEEE